MTQYDVIKGPLVTEKSTSQKEDHNQVSIEVDRHANRVEIKQAVERIFKVRVSRVRTMQIKGKVKRRGAVLGKRKDWKKAIVSLAAGERIEFFDGI